MNDLVHEDQGAPGLSAERIGWTIIHFFESGGQRPAVGCPACGAVMIVRVRGRDGRAFLGCSRYSSCFGSRDIPACVQEESKRWERRMMSGIVPPSKKDRSDHMSDESVSGTSDSMVSGIAARLKKSAAAAPYRVARMRALTEGRAALLAALKPRVQPAAFDIVEAFLETDVGQGAVIGLIGVAGPMTPKFGKNKHVQALCDEFLEEGMAKGANQLLGLLASIIEPVIASAVASMPEISEVADKVVPKRRRRRVASTANARVPSSPPDEYEEDSVARPLRAVASR